MRTIELTESALTDIDEGYRFYEKQLPGLGSHFEATMMSEIRALHIDAGVHQLYFGRYFRKVAKRFPWSIYYLIEGDVIRIYGFGDHRRNPEWISDRLK